MLPNPTALPTVVAIAPNFVAKIALSLLFCDVFIQFVSEKKNILSIILETNCLNMQFVYYWIAKLINIYELNYLLYKIFSIILKKFYITVQQNGYGFKNLFLKSYEILNRRNVHAN